jgi:hypothetical protein
LIIQEGAFLPYLGGFSDVKQLINFEDSIFKRKNIPKNILDFFPFFLERIIVLKI